MSHTLMDERYTENRAKAQLTVDISRTVEAPIEEIFIFEAIPHNSKCRYGERGAADAKPKAQIILDVLSSILATQMPCRSRRSGA